MTDLAAELSNLPAVRGRFGWPDHEYVKGWGVFGLPFDSGHVLALRVFPENDFAPYRSLWHRDPGGRWSIHVDGARLDTASERNPAARASCAGAAPAATALGSPLREPCGGWTRAGLAGRAARA